MKLVKTSLIIVLILLAIGCDKEPALNLTTEDAVYESLFLKRIENTYSKYFLAGATENEWFINNPVDDVNWQEYLGDLGNIPMELIEELYRVNRESHSLNWKPIITNAEILPPSFAVRAKPINRHERCLIENGNGKYRSYYSVSKVAFTKSGDMALVKFSYLCAPLSGAGEFFAAFEFRENSWHVIGGHRLWVS